MFLEKIETQGRLGMNKYSSENNYKAIRIKKQSVNYKDGAGQAFKGLLS
jgi:hypothetical protein